MPAWQPWTLMASLSTEQVQPRHWQCKLLPHCPLPAGLHPGLERPPPGLMEESNFLGPFSLWLLYWGGPAMVVACGWMPFIWEWVCDPRVDFFFSWTKNGENLWSYLKHFPVRLTSSVLKERWPSLITWFFFFFLWICSLGRVSGNL